MNSDRATIALPPRRAAIGKALARSWPLILGLAALALPTMVSLGEQFWSRDEGAHGPIVLATGGWLLWRQLPHMERDRQPSRGWLAAVLLGMALPLYVFGRAYDFLSLEVSALYGIGLVLLYDRFGAVALRRNWFPCLYLAFAIPAPGWLIDRLTAPLKHFVSYAATEGLQMVGIPIFREGVTLYITRYQLLVEDACSGLNSIVGLVALGLFYIFVLRRASLAYSLALTALILPVAVTANLIRIVILVLLTYYFGDGVAQGFLHFAAGMVLFMVSLLLIFGIDALLSAGRKHDRAA
jgi:exosortase B